jgi:hypothetical protein
MANVSSAVFIIFACRNRWKKTTYHSKYPKKKFKKDTRGGQFLKEISRADGASWPAKD